MHKTNLAALISIAIAGAAHAHHGIANFDLNTDIELAGVVTEVDFMNPHSWLYLDVTAEDGTVTAWRCELRGSTVLRRSGWSEDMFPAGLGIRITGSPDRRDPTTCYLGTAFFPDGRSVDRYGQLTEPVREVPADRQLRLANGDPNIAGDWAAEQLVMTDPRGQSGTLVPISVAEQLEPGVLPAGVTAFPGARGTDISFADDPVEAFWNERPSAMPLTEAGAAAIAEFDGSSTDNPRLRCEPTNVLFDWTFEADVNRIVQSQTEIRILYGSMGIERVINLEATGHPADIEPSVAGHSIGRWEDDVLIVDTVGFPPGILSADGRIPHSDELHVVERFSLDTGTMALSRDYVATDPLYVVGEFAGNDVVLISDLPYTGTTECEDRTYVDTPAPQ
ncbi:DUF6152 family protein [Candidatus Rariloculus sp.]|uniref:DUF6152 family protein n=1 Tax=Candidatus Rariloculus sp. TaxID=3101265 RepID=UPI003D0BBE32